MRKIYHFFSQFHYLQNVNNRQEKIPLNNHQKYLQLNVVFASDIYIFVIPGHDERCLYREIHLQHTHNLNIVYYRKLQGIAWNCFCSKSPWTYTSSKLSKHCAWKHISIESDYSKKSRLQNYHFLEGPNERCVKTI